MESYVSPSGFGDLLRGFVTHRIAKERAAAVATPRTVDAEVSDERDEPGRDRAAVGNVLARAVAHDDERVVDDVLRLGAVAHDAYGEGQ